MRQFEGGTYPGVPLFVANSLLRSQVIWQHRSPDTSFVNGFSSLTETDVAEKLNVPEKT